MPNNDSFAEHSIKPHWTLEINADPGEFRLASLWLAQLCHEQSIPMHQIYRLDLCLNEVLANILNHGGEAALASAIFLNFNFTQDQDDSQASLVVSDLGIEFNPLNAEPQTTPQSLAEAEPGGLGLRMLFKFADDVSYSYQDGRNHLSFSIRWKNTP